MSMVFTPQNDFRGTGSTYDSTYPNFGVTVYKNYETNGGSYNEKNPLLSGHISQCVEMGCGAHYYSHGIYTSKYRKAETTINLSDITVDTKGRRVACASLGVIGYAGSCDMGIESFDGVNWFAHWWSWVINDGESNPVVPGAASVKITVEPMQTDDYDIIVGSYVWYDSAGNVINTDPLDCTMEKGKFFNVDSSGKTIQRFHRFMSLLPNDNLHYSPQSDTADGSKMIGGNLTNNKLYLANGSSVTWGTSLMNYIWSVQGWNISSFNPGNNDYFSCTHSNYLYNTNV